MDPFVMPDDLLKETPIPEQHFVEGLMRTYYAHLTGRSVTTTYTPMYELLPYIEDCLPSLAYITQVQRYFDLMDKESRAIVSAYTKHADIDLNKFLRTGSRIRQRDGPDGLYDPDPTCPPEHICIRDDVGTILMQLTLEEYADRLQRIVRQAPALDKDIVVFRGSTYNEFGSSATDEVILSRGMLSTSLLYTVANKFASMKPQQGYITQIFVPAGTRCLYMLPHITKFPFEYELLLPSGNKYYAVRELKPVPPGQDANVFLRKNMSSYYWNPNHLMNRVYVLPRDWPAGVTSGVKTDSASTLLRKYIRRFQERYPPVSEYDRFVATHNYSSPLDEHMSDDLRNLVGILAKNRDVSAIDNRNFYRELLSTLLIRYPKLLKAINEHTMRHARVSVASPAVIYKKLHSFSRRLFKIIQTDHTRVGMVLLQDIPYLRLEVDSESETAMDLLNEAFRLVDETS